MSNMKDYMMWLDDNGVANWDTDINELIIPEDIDIYAPELVDEYRNDASWHSPTTKTDDDDFIIDEDEELIIDDGDLDDCVWTPDAYWFTEQGGLTGDAMNFLHTLDSQGELV
jgi:hypothetical protein